MLILTIAYRTTPVQLKKVRGVGKRTARRAGSSRQEGPKPAWRLASGTPERGATPYCLNRRLLTGIGGEEPLAERTQLASLPRGSGHRRTSAPRMSPLPCHIESVE